MHWSQDGILQHACMFNRSDASRQRTMAEEFALSRSFSTARMVALTAASSLCAASLSATAVFLAAASDLSRFEKTPRASVGRLACEMEGTEAGQDAASSGAL